MRSFTGGAALFQRLISKRVALWVLHCCLILIYCPTPTLGNQFKMFKAQLSAVILCFSSCQQISGSHPGHQGVIHSQ